MQKMMIATHAHMASGIISSLKLLTGLGDDIPCVDAYVDGNDDFSAVVANFIKQTEGQPAVIFTDLLGGSVNQKMMVAASSHPNITVVTQTNLAVVMSAALSTEPLTRENVEKMIASCQVQVAGVDGGESEDDSF